MSNVETAIARKVYPYSCELYKKLNDIRAYLLGGDECKEGQAETTGDIVEEVLEELQLCLRCADEIQEIVLKIK